MSTHEHIYIIGKRLAATAALVGLFAKSALAGNVVCAAQPVLDSGNTAWMIVATALVLLMSIPGIALFYGGLVRQKNVLSIIMQTMLIVGVISILWVAIGYTWAFGTGFKESGSPLFFVVGGLDKAFLNGITTSTIMPTGIPELVFVMFQCMFALITPALILGAFAERIKFKGYMIFIILWTILAYFPMAHWVWGGGFLQEMGAIDFAGGTVSHLAPQCRFCFPWHLFPLAGLVRLQCGQWIGRGRHRRQRSAGDTHRHRYRRCCLDGHRLDLQQEAHDGRRVHWSGSRTGGYNSCRGFNRFARSFLHWFDYSYHLLLHGGRGKAEIQVR